MKLIAHRGNINGAVSQRENTPEYIQEALDLGYDVEIDVRHHDGKILLGHDNGETHIPLDWIQDRKENLWIHCKNLEALRFLNYIDGLNFFWHQEDDFTLTSKNIIWTYPKKPTTENSVLVCFTEDEMFEAAKNPLFGICCDWVGKLG